VRRIAIPAEVIPIEQHVSRNLEELVERRVQFLTGYQDAAYAEKYRNLVNRVVAAEKEKTGSTKLAEAVARYYAKLLAYKDEYEVARLYTDGRFEKQLRDQFEGDFKFSFNLAPPLLGGGTDALGRPRKRAFGAWMMPVFRLLAKMRGLRGTVFDIFGYSADRRLERDMIAGYEKDVAHILSVLSPATLGTAIEILALPDRIRGYGPVKERAVQEAKARYAQLAADLASPPPAPRQIAAE
jgi:indolepyruvate ferredoxin oxidoreductase